MPIRPDLRKFYSGRVWRETRARIRARAGDRCEQCGKPDRVKIFTVTARCEKTPLMFWRTVHGRGTWHNLYGQKLPDPPARSWGIPRMIHVVCTCAHLNHVPGDDRDENLKFLCQWCYDKLHHKESRCARKDAARPLFQKAV